MTLSSYSGRLMDYGFPTPPQSDRTHLAHEHKFARRTSKDPIEDAILRLNATEGTEVNAQNSRDSAPSPSNAANRRVPSTPTTPSSPACQPLKPLPLSKFSVLAASHAKRSMQTHPRTTTNRKILKVRSNYRSSQLRTEVSYCVDTELDRNFQSPQECAISKHYISNCSELGGPSSPGNNRLHLAARPLHHLPSPSVQACIRAPNHVAWSARAAEEKYRFPSRQSLRQNGNPCSSVPCTAPNSQYGTPIESPFATPPRSPIVSAGPSSQHVGCASGTLEETKLDTTADGRSIHCIKNHPDDAHPAGPAVPRTEASNTCKEGTEATHQDISGSTHCPIRHNQARAIRDWEENGDGDRLSPRSQSVASSNPKVVSKRRCVLLARLKSMFRKRGVKAGAEEL
ncbi:hypothetical protein SVAN01_02909 [Stagonosporopsis vannaccii]|nr:hypothetical protein SVAN01_02909 [Stagonosporopsis vannaccii]